MSLDIQSSPELTFLHGLCPELYLKVWNAQVPTAKNTSELQSRAFHCRLRSFCSSLFICSSDHFSFSCCCSFFRKTVHTMTMIIYAAVAFLQCTSNGPSVNRHGLTEFCWYSVMPLTCWHVCVTPSRVTLLFSASPFPSGPMQPVIISAGTWDEISDPKHNSFQNTTTEWRSLNRYD